MSWTPQRIKTLKTLWIAGQSASEIGALLGVTRNAVIGKVHRLGLCGQGGWRQKPREPKAKAAPKPPRVERPRLAVVAPPVERPALVVVAPAPPPETAPDGGKRLIDRRSAECAYALGAAPDGHEMVCGQPTGDRKRSFCAEHGKGLYLPAPKLKPRAFTHTAVRSHGRWVDEDSGVYGRRW